MTVVDDGGLGLGIAYADQLQDMLEDKGRQAWPLPQEAAIRDRLIEYAAFAESNSEVLQTLCGWQTGKRQNLPYVVDPLAERIKDAFADLIFGAETDFEAAAPESEGDTSTAGEGTKVPVDQELLDALVDENDLAAELQDAAARCVAEGEVWWRIYTDRDAFEHPIIEWHSRLNVVPLFRGRKLLAAAFVSDLSNLAPDAPVVRTGDTSDPPGTTMWRQQQTTTSESPDVWRYVEIQAPGMTRSLLYKGERSKLGEPRPLGEHVETADLDPEWRHDLSVSTAGGREVPLMLAGRVTNGTAGRLGRSQYAGIRDLLYELNKLASIGGRNVELTMQKRAVLSADVVASMVREDPVTGETSLTDRTRADLPDAFLTPREADQMGETPLMGVLEFSDAWAEALLAWDGGLTDKILTRARVAPQLVGRHTEDAATGPALRARLLDSVLAADGKARKWDSEGPKILRAAQMVSALEEERGGCGNDWQRPDEIPTMVRSSVLPEDESEEVTRHAEATGARIESRRTAIETMHPEWDEDRVQEEVNRIDDETPKPPPPPAPPGPVKGGSDNLPQGQRPPGDQPPGDGLNAQGGNGAGA